MKTQSSDTHPKVEELMILLIRKASIAKRISKVRSLTQSTVLLSRRAIKRANPDLNTKELNLKFVSFHYGDELAGFLREYMENKSL